MLSKKEFTAEVGKRIKKWREKRNMSQEELAYHAGLYRTYIGHLENARYSPSAYILYKIAKVLKVQVSDFYPSS
jgi:transcriptional regulator with XRE-family HTH domain